MRIYRDDSRDLGFVLAALMLGAIDKSELRAWADHVITLLDEPPLYLFDLCVFDEPAFHVYKLIGFIPNEYEGNDDALAGIAVSRGRTIDDTLRSPEKALKALERNPKVAEQFRSAFPFLEF